MLVGLLASGCARRSPTIDVLGSYFPAWIVCMLVGLLCAIVLRLLLMLVRLDDLVGPKPIFYPAIMVIIAMLTWLLVYSP